MRSQITRYVAGATLFLSAPVFAHGGHGMADAHWHASDTLGFLLVGGLTALVIWWSRGE